MIRTSAFSTQIQSSSESENPTRENQQPSPQTDGTQNGNLNSQTYFSQNKLKPEINFQNRTPTFVCQDLNLAAQDSEENLIREVSEPF